MRILFITPWYPDDERPNSGIFIRQQAVALAEQHAVVVVAIKVNYKHRAFAKYNATKSIYKGVQEHRLVVSQSLPFYNQFNYLRIAVNFAREVGQSFRPDIIHASIGYPGAVVGWRLSKKLNVPFVFTEHTRPRNNFRSWWHKLSAIASMRQATTVMAVSNALATEINKLISTKPIIIPNMVDVHRYTTVSPSSDRIWQLGFIGGMNTPVKGLDILLNALSKIEEPFFLHICGDGVLMQTYRTLADELGLSTKCRFYGFVDPSAMPTFYSKLHFVICASRYETFNVSLIESMACGFPVVSTRCGGPEDFVTAENGLLCEPENAEALAAAIRQMIDQYGDYDADKVRTSAKRFDPQVVAQQLTQVYSDTIKAFNR
jgi:L-malate glycosyltransferase